MKNRSCVIILGAILTSICLYGQDKPYMENLPYYVENLEVFGEGQEEGRAFHIPENCNSLNGTWKFLYADCPADIPQDFFKPSFNDRKWADITIPSNWEMQGFGQAVFRNVTTPWPTAASYAVAPPGIPMDLNPTGAYRTSSMT